MSQVPFYAALLGRTTDWTLTEGLTGIPIEERSGDEVRFIRGLGASSECVTINILLTGSPAANPAFDVTPARLITGLITEHGIAKANAAGLVRFYPEMAHPINKP